jgi:hypothetical protein
MILENSPGKFIIPNLVCLWSIHLLTTAGVWPFYSFITVTVTGMMAHHFFTGTETHGMVTDSEACQQRPSNVITAAAYPLTTLDSHSDCDYYASDSDEIASSLTWEHEVLYYFYYYPFLIPVLTTTQLQLDLQIQPQSQTQPESPIPDPSDWPTDETLPEAVRVFRDMFRRSTTPTGDSYFSLSPKMESLSGLIPKDDEEGLTKVRNIGIVGLFFTNLRCVLSFKLNLSHRLNPSRRLNPIPSRRPNPIPSRRPNPSRSRSPSSSWQQRLNPAPHGSHEKAHVNSHLDY